VNEPKKSFLLIFRNGGSMWYRHDVEFKLNS